MGEVWLQSKLADACSTIDYGLTASASQNSGGPRFLRITDIATGPVDWKTVPYVIADSATISKYRLSNGDIVIARTGASTGASAFIKDPPEAVFASYLVRLKTKPEFDSRFVAYYLKSNAFWSFIRGVLGDKSAQPNASASTMTQAPFRFPKNRNTQTAIAQILGALDDKIELNRRSNETLEAIARALYKSCFVYFEPVRAKAEGRNSGLSEAFSKWFPDSFSDSELGLIPSGWDVGSILDVANLLSGGTPKTERQEYWNGNIPWASAKDVSQCGSTFLIDTERNITAKGLAESSTQMIPAFSTVVVARGATTGRMALLGREMTMNQTCYALATKVGAPFGLYCQLRHEMERLVHAAHGSVFDTITTSTFANSTILLPLESALKGFEKKVNPLFRRILRNIEESHTLGELRDALLPRLLSGELCVKAAERIVGDSI